MKGKFQIIIFIIIQNIFPREWFKNIDSSINHIFTKYRSLRISPWKFATLLKVSTQYWIIVFIQELLPWLSHSRLRLTPHLISHCFTHRYPHCNRLTKLYRVLSIDWLITSNGGQWFASSSSPLSLSNKVSVSETPASMSVCARVCLYLSVCRADVCQSLPAGPEAAEVAVWTPSNW